MENDQQSSPFSQYPPSGNFSSIPPSEDGPLKHSKLGVASFVISLVSVLLIVVSIILAFVFVSQIANNEDVLNEFNNIAETYASGIADSKLFDSEAAEGAMLTIIGAVVLIFGAIGIAFVGLILGIIGVVAKNRRKVFGIIGVVLNGLIVVGSGGFFIISLVLGASAVG